MRVRDAFTRLLTGSPNRPTVICNKRAAPLYSPRSRLRLTLLFRPEGLFPRHAKSRMRPVRMVRRGNNAFALSCRTTAARMCSFTFRRSSVPACTISTKARSFRSTCRPIHAAASPRPRICKRFSNARLTKLTPALSRWRFLWCRERHAEQDREIAEKSGRAPLAIKSIRRTGAKIKDKDRAREKAR